MIMMAEPLTLCLQEIRSQRSEVPPVVLFSPVGRQLNHSIVTRWAQSQGAVLICGRYEGIDQRFIDAHVTEQISMGDFVLSGGEVPAMALLDAVARLQPGVLNAADSHEQDSFNPVLDGLLDCPHYTRPEMFNGEAVPSVLLSGNHAEIQRWRLSQSLGRTWLRRPDLFARRDLTKEDARLLAEFQKEQDPKTKE